jgi:putative NIF3 family GTP cyclohydrolase 1 type 2
VSKVSLTLFTNPCNRASSEISYGSGFQNAGVGRILTFPHPVLLTTLITRIAKGVGLPKGFPVAIPQSIPLHSITIRTVAICAGSGSHVFSGVNADLYFTGELSHHEALAIIEKGGCVVTLFHSNTERGFLGEVLKGQLEKQLRDELGRVRGEDKVLGEEEVRVDVSERDRDPFGMVILQENTEVGTAVGVGKV